MVGVLVGWGLVNCTMEWGQGDPPPVRSADDLNHLPIVVDHKGGVNGGESLSGTFRPLKGCTTGLASAGVTSNQEGASSRHDR